MTDARANTVSARSHGPPDAQTALRREQFRRRDLRLHFPSSIEPACDMKNDADSENWSASSDRPEVMFKTFSQKQNGEKDAQTNSSIALAIMLISPKAGAQTVTNIAVLKGLGPLTILDHSEVGKAALGSNFTVTGGIQTGTISPQ
jgi:hypothetical protein